VADAVAHHAACSVLVARDNSADGTTAGMSDDTRRRCALTGPRPRAPLVSGADGAGTAVRDWTCLAALR
jgi:hypothetical protein